MTGKPAEDWRIVSLFDNIPIKADGTLKIECIFKEIHPQSSS